jgi:hypothetical protein
MEQSLGSGARENLGESADALGKNEKMNFVVQALQKYDSLV